MRRVTPPDITRRTAEKGRDLLMTKKRLVAFGATLAVAAGVLATSAFAPACGTPGGNHHSNARAPAPAEGPPRPRTALSATGRATAAPRLNTAAAVATR